MSFLIIPFSKKKDKPFMTSQIKSQLKQVKILHTRKLRTGKSSDHDLYDEARRKVKHEINLSKKHHEENVYNRLLNSKLATKQYWKLVKTYLPGNVSSSSINVRDPMTNDQIISEEEKANLLNIFFVQSTCLPARSPNHSLPDLIYLTDARLCSIHTTPFEVEYILKRLDCNKSTGPDGVSNRVLKEAAFSLSHPLADIFNKSLE